MDSEHPCLGNATDRGTWPAAVHGPKKNWTQLETEH